MRHTGRIQAIAAALALLFVGAQATETFGVHSCPRHHHESPVPATGVGVTAPADAPHDAGGLPFCTCVGSCHGGAASPMPADDAAAVLVGPRSLARTTAVPERERPRDRGAYFLPFPNGPPAV